MAELLLKVTLVNLCYAAVGYTDPLGFLGGVYEVPSPPNICRHRDSARF